MNFILIASTWYFEFLKVSEALFDKFPNLYKIYSNSNFIKSRTTVERRLDNHFKKSQTNLHTFPLYLLWLLLGYDHPVVATNFNSLMSCCSRRVPLYISIILR